MKKIAKWMGLLLTIVVLVGTAIAADEVPEKAIVRVNSQYIMEDIYNLMLTNQLTELTKGYGEEVLESEDFLVGVKQRLIESCIANEVLRQCALESGVVISKQEINDELAQIKKRFPDEDTFQQVLEEAKYPMELLKHDITMQLYFDKLKEKLTEEIVVTDDEMMNYYENNMNEFSIPETVEAHHILVDTQDLATELRERVLAGEDFSALAQEYSTCPSGEEGGLLGYIEPGGTVAEFENVAFALEIGELSEPVKSEFGWHIIKITNKKDAIVYTYEESIDVIKETIKNMKENNIAIEYLQKHLKEADIEYYQDFMQQPENDHETEQSS